MLLKFLGLRVAVYLNAPRKERTIRLVYAEFRSHYDAWRKIGLEPKAAREACYSPKRIIVQNSWIKTRRIP